MILVITNKRDITSDLIIYRLKQLEYEYYRLNTEDIGLNTLLTLNIKHNDFIIYDKNQGKQYHSSSFKSIYFRRPDLPSYDHFKISCEEILFLKKEVSFLLEGLYSILKNNYWISYPEKIKLAENKVYQLLLAQQIGFLTPKTIISNNYEDCLKFLDNQFKITKAIKSGLVEYNQFQSFIYSNKVSKDSISSEDSHPILLQDLILKKSDIRVTVIEDQVYSVSINSNKANSDWRKLDVNDINYERHSLPESIEYYSIQLLQSLSLKFGAIDFILDDENNPNNIIPG